MCLVNGSRIICGICGARMRVRYMACTDSLVPYYVCARASVDKAGKLCQSIRGVYIDSAISKLVQEIVSPATAEVAFAVQQEISERIKQAEDLRGQQLERARYDAELARRRYLKVDPDNRLVADTLEADWNEKLRALNQMQQEHEQQRKKDNHSFTQESSERIIRTIKDFPSIWNDANVPAIERKKIIAHLIEDTTLVMAEKVALHIRFKGGKTKSIFIDRPPLRRTSQKIIEALDKLLDTHTDHEAAIELDKMGYRNWKNKPLTHYEIRWIRYSYGIKSIQVRLRERGWLNVSDMAKKLGVAISTVRDWSLAGLINKKSYGKRRIICTVYLMTVF